MMMMKMILLSVDSFWNLAFWYELVRFGVKGITDQSSISRMIETKNDQTYFPLNWSTDLNVAQRIVLVPDNSKAK